MTFGQEGNEGKYYFKIEMTLGITMRTVIVKMTRW